MLSGINIGPRKIVSSASPEVSHVQLTGRGKTGNEDPLSVETPTRISSRPGIWLMGSLNRNFGSYISWGEVGGDLGSYKCED